MLKIKKNNESVLSIGNFDGVHLGHQKILQTVKELSIKHKIEASIISFYPSPFSFLYPGKFYGHIDTYTEKNEKIKKHGIDNIEILEFNNKIRHITAEDFLSNIIIDCFKPKVIVVGYDHHFGYNKKGDYDFLYKNREKYNYELIKINKELIEEMTISSSKIRESLLSGKVDIANKMLGSFFKIKGIVIKGSQLGKKIGFPTANIKVEDLKLIPGKGVYLVIVKIFNKEYMGMCNIGTKPTINTENKKISFEVHILDFKKNIYEECLEINFVKFIRKEKKFSSILNLKKQLIADRNKCLEYSFNNV
tara:strand:+ start:52 stop:969 length:918 start_codon:yes stop_codon:yes gene_type:complete